MVKMCTKVAHKSNPYLARLHPSRHYRLRVKDVLDMLASGVGEKEILEDYSFLEPEDIRACLEFAAEQVNYPVLVGA